MYVVVDWRPYDLPEIYGPFTHEADADRYARKAFEVDTDAQDLPDGIDVRPLNHPFPFGDSQYHADYPLGA